MGRAGPNGAKARKEPALNVHHLSAQPSSRLRYSTSGSFAPSGLTLFRSLAHGLRRGLHSGGATRLKTGGLPFKLLFLTFIIILAAPVFAQSWRIADFQDVIYCQR